MLTSVDQAFLEAKLTALLVNQALPRQFVATNMPSFLAASLGEGLPPGTLARVALKICEDDAYNATPPSLCVFLEQCFPSQKDVAAVIDRLRTPPPAIASAPDPFDAVFLANKLPFLGRTAVRAHLRSLMQANPQKPVVVVNGLGGSGKTYTTELIKHACRSHTAIVPCHVEVAKEQGSTIGPTELAKEIVIQLGGDVDRMPPQQTNADRWAQELAIWIVNVAQKSGFKHWIILDGFSASELRRDTLTLIVKLSLQLTRGVASRAHRLILIDFDYTSLPMRPGDIAIDSIPGLDKGVVTAFLNEFLQSVGREADATTMIEAVTADLSNPVVDLRELGNRLGDLIELVG